MQKLQKVQAIKDSPVSVIQANDVAKLELESWPLPSDSNLMFNSSTKILWGYWHTGLDNAPNICHLALKSWKVKNPTWQIKILSDQNYKEYVDSTDLPLSTFHSLKVQHRSDLIKACSRKTTAPISRKDALPDVFLKL